MKKISRKVTTPLDRALATPVARRNHVDVTQGEIDLAFAWMQDKIGMTQAAAGLGEPRSGTVLYKIACYIREGYRRGQLTVR